MNPIITTITPYRDRPDHLNAWMKCVNRASNAYMRHLLIVPGGMKKTDAAIFRNNDIGFIELHEPKDLPSGIMTIGHWHNWAAKELVTTPWIMKMDVDCLAHTEFFNALVEHVLVAGQREYFNIGFFNMSRTASTIVGSGLPYAKYRSMLDDLKRITGKADAQPAGSHFVCRTADYLDCGGCLPEFVGYGWEDYQQLYMLERMRIGDDPLHGIVDIHNVTQRCRDEISRPRCRSLFKLDTRLALMHKWHGSSNDPKYKTCIENNRRVLLKYVLEQKAMMI